MKDGSMQSSAASADLIKSDLIGNLFDSTEWATQSKSSQIGKNIRKKSHCRSHLSRENIPWIKSSKIMPNGAECFLLVIKALRTFWVRCIAILEISFVWTTKCHYLGGFYWQNLLSNSVNLVGLLLEPAHSHQIKSTIEEDYRIYWVTQ